MVADEPSAAQLAAAIHNGPWAERLIAIRVSRARGRLNVTPWATQLASDIVSRWPDRPQLRPLERWLAHYPPPEPIDDRKSVPQPPPPPGFDRMLRGRAPGTRIELARLLDLTMQELLWFADVQSRNARTSQRPLQQYRYRIVASESSVRLLEIPKPRLKELQRRLVTRLFSRITLHDAAHGSVPGRSVASCVAPHAGSAVIVRCDLERFFTSITRTRVAGFLRAAGIDPAVAELVAGLSTTTTPARVLRTMPHPVGAALLPARWRLRRGLATPHLPQGGPSSPAVANAIAFGLDHRLTSLAQSLDGRYTRYVDDLIFSLDYRGDSPAVVGALLAGVRTIVADEDFRLNEAKTAVLRSSKRQWALGTVLNERTAISRPELDRLRAILHNCSVHGIRSQARDRTVEEFRQWLQGTIAWVQSVDPRHSEQLAASFKLLDWDS